MDKRIQNSLLWNDLWHVSSNLNGGYRLPRASCGNGQYTPPTSNSLSHSLTRITPVWCTPYLYDRPVARHLLRVIIVIYAPTTNVTSLICPNLLILRSCWTRKLTLFCNCRQIKLFRVAIITCLTRWEANIASVFWRL